MTAHKHSGMIKVKADNMELVVFIKCTSNWQVQICNEDQLNFSEGHDYFLCLPQHKESCLHWLNGGEVEVMSRKAISQDWVNLPNYSERPQWIKCADFMCDYCEIRIKPRKEKRFIFAYRDGSCSMHYSNKDELYREYSSGEAQLIEVEVEV